MPIINFQKKKRIMYVIEMGKVRTILIKNVSKELINKYPNVFTTDFEINKKLLDKYLVID